MQRFTPAVNPDPEDADTSLDEPVRANNLRKAHTILHGVKAAQSLVRALDASPG